MRYSRITRTDGVYEQYFSYSGIIQAIEPAKMYSLANFRQLCKNTGNTGKKAPQVYWEIRDSEGWRQMSIENLDSIMGVMINLDEDSDSPGFFRFAYPLELLEPEKLVGMRCKFISRYIQHGEGKENKGYQHHETIVLRYKRDFKVSPLESKVGTTGFPPLIPSL